MGDQHLGHWILAEKLLGRPVPRDQPYPCLRREVGHRHCACPVCSRAPAAPAGAETPGLPADEFATLLATVTTASPGDPVTPAGAPASQPDPEEDLPTRITRICRTHSSSAARSQQKMIGLSEIGQVCDRRITYQLWQMPPVNTARDNWLADVGTYTHTGLADAFAAENQRLGRTRYLIEERVYLTDGYSGTCDLFDVDTGTVIDHKLLGITSLRKIRDGVIPPHYRVQLHSYGYGHVRAGRQVREVALACYPRSDNLAGDFGGLGLHIHTEPYDEQVALQGLDRLSRLSALGYQLDPEQHPDRWSLIQATPGDHCQYCPFFRPDGGPADDTGCPGQPVPPPTSMPGIL